MKKVRFLDPAEQEMLDAARYYESQAVGLGEDFLAHPVLAYFPHPSTLQAACSRDWAPKR